MFGGINIWAVIVAAIASMVIGSIWHGPLFGKLFMREMGMNEWSPEKQAEMKKTMTRSYIIQFIASCVMFFVLAWYIITSPHDGLKSGLGNAFRLWLGFVVPLALSQAIWGGKMKIFWINIGNMLLTLLVAGAIIGLWR
jgi:uncharacterized membrane protein YqgA involved in biofilm formation